MEKNKNFIAKLETDKYYIGSFDAYIEKSIELLSKKREISKEKAQAEIEKMPTTMRASIVRKSDNQYVGYLGVSNYNGAKESANVNCIVLEEMNGADVIDILKVYFEYLKNSFNIHHFNNSLNNLATTQDAIGTKLNANSLQLPKKFIRDNTNIEKEIEIVKSWNFSVPKLSYPRSIYVDGKFIGIIGLSNLNYSNKRADLRIYLNPDLGSDLIISVGSLVVNEYLEIVHEFTVHNIAASTNVSSVYNTLLNESNMKKFAEVPYTEYNKENLESRVLYQHIPNLKGSNLEQNLISYPSINMVLNASKTELSKKINLDANYSLVRPSAFLELGIDLETILQGHIHAMQNREKFAIPLGEDKYFLQRGNEKYGIYKSLMNFSYVIVDNQGHYAGYVNILRKEGKHVEIEIGISPDLQAKGLGRKAIETFYQELFSLGYLSITSCVFSFNQQSILLHEKVAEFNGTRVESYYINGKLWDMNYYTAINPTIDLQNTVKK